MKPSRWVVGWVASVLSMGCGRATQPTPRTMGDASRPAHAVEAPAPSPSPPAARHDWPEGETQPAPPPPAGVAVATFAGGCFWCMEAAFEALPGVSAVLSGYTGGPELHPSYEAVSNHGTGHAEAIRVLYDPARVRYGQLLDLFWRRIMPTGRDQAFADQGHQYRSAIFVHDAAQRAEAERSRQAIIDSGRFNGEGPITTTVEDAPVFWVAEDYHQDFYRTHPDRYNGYHEHSGRREYLRAHWGPDAAY